MAKKKKKSNKKSSTAETSSSSGFWAAAGALLLVVLGVVLLFGIFISAPIPKGMWDGVWWALGGASFLAPFALVYFGILKFTAEDHQIPLGKMIGVLGLITMFASWLHAAFVKDDAATGGFIGGYGGAVGELLGNAAVGLLGQFLASLLFFVLALIAFMFTFSIPPQNLLGIFGLFRRKKGDEDEDLANLKAKMQPGFRLNEGVPVEHHPAGASRGVSTKAPKVTAAVNQAALTAVRDPDWQFPPLSLLSQKQDKADAGDVQGNAEIIKDTFAQFDIDVEVEGANIGPRVTQYTLKPPSGVKLEKLTALEKNLSLNLAAQSLRMEAPIPGKRSVGIEVPNVKSATVTLHSLLSGSQWSDADGALNFAVGKDISGTPLVTDLEDMPHLLIAGQTKAGKSVMINALLASFLFRNSPSDLKLILVDPKHVEMAPYDDIPHLIAPVITEPEKCISALKWAVAEMERRLKTFAEIKQRDIQGYNEVKKEEGGMPHIVVVIDELSELMMIAPRDVEALIARIAQKARAAGIHLVLATQRPEAKVVTGLIKANVPARIAFAVQDQINSRIIIDSMGAEKLLGKGDMLFKTTDINKPIRVQGALITGNETNKLCDFLRAQRPPDYNEDVITQAVQIGKGGNVVSMGSSNDEEDDDMWRDAVQVVVEGGKASTSLLQRKLRLGYGRASRIIDMMEEQGIVGPADGSKPRQVLVQSVDEVFGGNAQSGGSEGDVYDDMPDDDQNQYGAR